MDTVRNGELAPAVKTGLGVCCIVLALAGCGKDKAGSTAGQPVVPAGDKLLVSVGNSHLMKSEVDRQVDRKLSAALAAGQVSSVSAPEATALRINTARQAADTFIARAVLLAEAKRQKKTVADPEIDASIEEFTGRLPEGTDLGEALDVAGVMPSRFRETVGEDLLIKKLLEEKMADIPEPSDQEIGAFYKDQLEKFVVPENVHARHILVSCVLGSDEATQVEKQALANSLRDRIVAGEDFAKVAAGKSDCPSRASGGDLGTFARGSAPEEFEGRVFSMETNAISPVIRSRIGYHVVEVLKHTPTATNSLEDVALHISAFLKNGKQQAAVADYIAELREAADVTIGKVDKP